MAETLYTFLKSATDQQSRSGESKVQFGYTVDSYKGVLAALERAKQQIITNSGIGAGGDIGGGFGEGSGGYNTRWKRWTQLSSGISVGSLTSDGLVVDENGSAETYRRMVVQCLPYYSVPIDIKSKDGIPVPKIFKSKYPLDSSSPCASGITLVGGNNPKFPNKVINHQAFVDSLGSEKNPFKVGIFADFDMDVLKFFTKCFSKITTWDTMKLMKLAQKGLLYAQIAFSTVTTTEVKGTKDELESPVKSSVDNDAVAINMQVIGAISSSTGGHGKIYFPSVVLCLQSFKQLGKIKIVYGQKDNIANGTGEEVGGEIIKSPLARAKFNHQQSIIEDFTPQLIKQYSKDTKEAITINESNSYVKFRSGTTFDSDGGGYSDSQACFIRYYFKKGSEADVQSQFGGIPEQYAKELFKGAKEAIINEQQVVVQDGGFGTIGEGLKTDSAFYAEGQIDWVKFRQRHPKLPEGHDKIIENIAKQFNINTRMWMTQMGLETGWFTSKNFKTRRNPGGISAGSNYTGGKTYTLDYLGGVRATRAVEVRGEGYGHYWIFETFEDGYRAMAYLLVNSKRYGLSKFGAQTVYEHFTNMYKGGYCDLREAVCQSYNDKLMNQYANLY